MTKSSRPAVSVAVALAMLPLAARAEQTITFAGYSGIFQEKFTEAVIAPFEASHPDIKVKYLPTFNSAQMIGALVAQKVAPEVDVVLMDIVGSKSATDQGVFEKIEPLALPGQPVLVDYVSSDGIAGLPVTADYPVIIYNPAGVTAVPTSWSVLGENAYRGKIAVSAPPGLLGVAFTVIMDKMAGGTDPTTDLSKGIAAVADLAPSVMSFESKDWYPSVANGEVLMALGWNSRAQLYDVQTEGAVKAAIPTDGLVRQINTINLVANAPRRDGAIEFIDYVLSAEAQSAIGNSLFYAPVNTAATLNVEALARTGASHADEVIPMDWIAFAPMNATMTQAWRRKVTGN